MFRRLVELTGRFRADRKGATALLFGITLIPLFVGIGLGIDYGRALSAKTRLGQAIDAAALAVGSWPDLTEDEIAAKAQAYVSANFPPGTIGAPTSFTVVKNENKVTIEVDSEVDTTILKIIGINKVDIGAFTEVAMKEKKIELVMVLDNTGSMSWSGKIGALKDAANILVAALFGEDETSEDVKIGLVPFAAAVNIGSDKLGSGWIDVNAQSSIAPEDFQPGTNPLTLYGQITNRSWNGCVRARPEPYDTTDAAPDAANPSTLWVPYFAPDEPDFSWYANRYASDNGYSGGTYDYDARQRYTGKYEALTVSSSNGPHFNCQTQPVTPMTNVKAQITAAVNAMNASGSTVIPAGLAWGWRLISPTEPFTEGVAYDDENTIKAIVLLTDGQNDVGGGLSNHNNSYYNAYGFAQSGHLGATSGWQAETVLNAKTATLCSNIKAQDVRLYTITFQLSDGPIKDLMRNCATEPEMYYDSPNNSQLETVFQDIAKGLNELRLAK